MRRFFCRNKRSQCCLAVQRLWSWTRQSFCKSDHFGLGELFEDFQHEHHQRKRICRSETERYQQGNHNRNSKRLGLFCFFHYQGRTQERESSWLHFGDRRWYFRRRDFQVLGKEDIWSAETHQSNHHHCHFNLELEDTHHYCRKETFCCWLLCRQHQRSRKTVRSLYALFSQKEVVFFNLWPQKCQHQYQRVDNPGDLKLFSLQRPCDNVPCTRANRRRVRTVISVDEFV